MNPKLSRIAPAFCLLLSACSSIPGLAIPTAMPTATALVTATAIPTTTATPIPTPTPTPLPLLVTVNAEAECRAGPGEDYVLLATIPAGQKLNVVARSEDSAYWIATTDQGLECWVDSAMVTAAESDQSRLAELTPRADPPIEPPLAPSDATFTTKCKELYEGDPAMFLHKIGFELTIVLKWVDNATNEQGYTVFRNGVMVKTLDASATEYVYITESPRHFSIADVFVIVAWNKAGNSKELEVTVAVNCP